MADTGGGDLGHGETQGSRRAREETPRSVAGPLLAERAGDGGRWRRRRAALGMARGAFAARVVLAHVRGDTTGPEAPDRELLGELVRATMLVHRIGVNLNQAVAKLNATGQRSGDLLPYAEGVHAPRRSPGRDRRAGPEVAALTSRTATAATDRAAVRLARCRRAARTRRAESGPDRRTIPGTRTAFQYSRSAVR